jgi:hypothetical protein
VREGRSLSAEAPRSMDAVEQGTLGNEEPASQHMEPPENILTPIEEVVPSIQNPLTSSESFFLMDSSGKQRMDDHSARRFVDVR